MTNKIQLRYGMAVATISAPVECTNSYIAHEFGHDWFGHSQHQCSSWAGPQHVMGRATCE